MTVRLHPAGFAPAVYALTLLAATSSASAVVVIDQPSQSGAIQIEYYSPVGQSFTAVTESITSIGAALYNMNVALPAWLANRTLTLNLIGGPAFDGALLASSTVDVAAQIGDEENAFGMVDFPIVGVSLTVGATYTFQLVAESPRFGVGLSWDFDAYDGGQAYFADYPGGPNAGLSDLTFRVSAAPVPEPQAWLLMLAGLGLVAASRRRLSSAE